MASIAWIASIGDRGSWDVTAKRRHIVFPLFIYFIVLHLTYTNPLPKGTNSSANIQQFSPGSDHKDPGFLWWRPKPNIKKQLEEPGGNLGLSLIVQKL